MEFGGFDRHEKPLIPPQLKTSAQRARSSGRMYE